MHYGRKILYTDVPEITYNNVLEVLREAYAEHLDNSNRIDYMLRYEEGEQPLQREKKTRTDIDIKCVDNLANEITEFKCSFNWQNAMSLVQNGDVSDKRISEAISELNQNYEMAKIKAKTQELARFVEIGALCYVLIDTNTDWKPGKSYFTLDVLDPRTAFVIRSNYYPDKRVMLGVSYRHDNSTGNNYFTCFTKNERFEIVNLQEIIGEDGKSVYRHEERSGEMNPLGIIPIVEYIRSYDRMGCFERQISEMNNLNLMISDFSNDVDQNTQAIWHGNDVEFPTEKVTNEDGSTTERPKKPGTNEWILTYTSPDGKQPFINPLAVNYDYSGMLNNIITRRQLILQKCNVPERNDNSGGSTGIAMSDATGWSQAENVAAKQQLITDSNKLDEVEVVLAAIRESPFVPQDSPLRELKISDIEVNVKRQKTYEMTTKVNAMATLLSHGFSLEDTVNAIPFFDDPNEVCMRSGNMVKKYQDSIINKTTTNSAEGGDGEQSPDSDKIMQDQSDQIDNSPMIDTNRAED